MGSSQSSAQKPYVYRTPHRPSLHTSSSFPSTYASPALNQSNTTSTSSSPTAPFPAFDSSSRTTSQQPSRAGSPVVGAADRPAAAPIPLRIGYPYYEELTLHMTTPEKGRRRRKLRGSISSLRSLA